MQITIFCNDNEEPLNGKGETEETQYADILLVCHAIEEEILRGKPKECLHRRPGEPILVKLRSNPSQTSTRKLYTEKSELD